LENKIVSYEFGDLCFSKSGKGKAIFLLHGFGEDSSIWKNQIQVFEKKFTIYNIDLPGTGNSSYLNKINCSISDYALAIDEIVIAEQLDDFCLFGHSMGGYIALAYAALFSEKLWGLGLIHSSAMADDEEKILARKKSIEFIQENGSEAFLRSTIPNLYFDPLMHRLQIADQLNSIKHISKQTLVQYYEAMMKRPDNQNLLGQCSFPILIVAGKHDKAVPFSKSLNQSFLAQKTYFKVLQASAHMGFIEETMAVNTAIEEYLQFACL
jgi:pimeloyl-ACP methyl ester carboxylesterase